MWVVLTERLTWKAEEELEGELGGLVFVLMDQRRLARSLAVGLAVGPVTVHHLSDKVSSSNSGAKALGRSMDMPTAVGGLGVGRYIRTVHCAACLYREEIGSGIADLSIFCRPELPCPISEPRL